MSEEPRVRERRSGKDRRQNKDRREDIRFEPGKADRRKSNGRRQGDNDIWHKALDGTDSAGN
ncbi:hypothetical protein [Neptuniibacter halophilus]|uniref:hypothetical protein n=1 Tax=Neptuniibacter halophilus TaxID=651666 RepID=UPI00257425C5|nr:hypothetical protein [Neptuniibacter halophilus]